MMTLFLVPLLLLSWFLMWLSPVLGGIALLATMYGLVRASR